MLLGWFYRNESTSRDPQSDGGPFWCISVLTNTNPSWKGHSATETPTILLPVWIKFNVAGTCEGSVKHSDELDEPRGLWVISSFSAHLMALFIVWHLPRATTPALVSAQQLKNMRMESKKKLEMPLKEILKHQHPSFLWLLYFTWKQVFMESTSSAHRDQQAWS